MQRAFRILIGSFLLLIEVSAGQQNPNPVSTEMKEILLIQKAETGDAQAQSEVVRLAESGDPKAEFALGQNYEYGMWSSKDHTQAMLWYRKAAEHGDFAARLSLGQMYFEGREVKQDFNEAVRWYGCPKPSESILARCTETSWGKLPAGAVSLLRTMRCRVGPNYDDGSVLELSDDGVPAYEVCCHDAPHGACDAVLIGRIGKEWKNLAASSGLFRFEGCLQWFYAS